jgi:hypothetical protein
MLAKGEGTTIRSLIVIESPTEKCLAVFRVFQKLIVKNT